MPQRIATIAAAAGLHARPASAFVQAVTSKGLPVTIALGDGPAANAASILSVLGLGANQGSVVTLRAEGEGAEGALDELVVLLEDPGADH